MAKRIVGSPQAQNDRREILEYWFERTANKKFSRKLAFQFRETIRYIAKHHYMGRDTALENVRVTVCANYLICYRLLPELVEIVTVFDGRRNPEDLEI